MLDLLDWADGPAPSAAHSWGEPRSSPARPPRVAFSGPRTASLARTAFSVFTEHHEDSAGVLDGDSDEKSEGGDEEVGMDDAEAVGMSQDRAESDDDLPELSFSSASERGSPSPSPTPVPPTPSPLDFDSLEERLIGFSRSPTPTKKRTKTQVGASELGGARRRPVAKSPSHRALSHSPRAHSPTRSPRPALKRIRSSSPPLHTLVATRSPRPTPDAAAEPHARSPSPTQAQMDAFFGFVNPYAAMRPVEKALLPGAEVAKADEPVRAGEDEETMGAADDSGQVDDSGGAGAARQIRTEASQEKAPVAPERQRYFQLAPIPKVSPETGLPLSQEEKRLAIIDSLERLALSVFEQIVDSVAPAPTEASSQEKGPVPTARQKIVVVLAKRGGKSGAQAGTGLAKNTAQKIQFPRRYGHGGNLRLGGRELACLLRVVELVLDGLKGGVICTKRDMYYRDVALFVKQYIVDSLVEDIAATLQVRRSDLNVVATAKGLFAGAVRLVLTDGSELSSSEQGALIPAGQAIERLELDEVKWILIIEKDAVFHSLAASTLLDDDELGNGVLLTGKGYPDVATRELVKRLADELPSTPIFALVDSDPHGLSILSVYAHGSSAQSHDAANLVVPRMRWLGVKGSEWDALGVERDELLPLTAADRKKALAMLKKGGLPSEWSRELEYMLHLNRKAEIQILSSSPPAIGDASDAQQPSQHGQSQQASSRIVEYVKKALWLELEDPEDAMEA